MAAVLERVPVAEIEAKANDIHFGRLMLTVFAALFFAVGWTVGKAWRAFAWSLAAVQVGFQAGRARTDGSG